MLGSVYPQFIEQRGQFLYVKYNAKMNFTAAQTTCQKIGASMPQMGSQAAQKAMLFYHS